MQQTDVSRFLSFFTMNHNVLPVETDYNPSCLNINPSYMNINPSYLDINPS